VVSWPLRKGAKLRCGRAAKLRCGRAAKLSGGIRQRRSGCDDHGEGRRRWRALEAATTKSAVVELMRIAWRTGGAIATCVVADARARRNPSTGSSASASMSSCRRGHTYLMVVVDHDTGRLVWAKAGRDRATLQCFFDLLCPGRAAKIRLMSADAAEWISDCTTNCENATLCLDPFPHRAVGLPGPRRRAPGAMGRRPGGRCG
jgi:transposase